MTVTEIEKTAENVLQKAAIINPAVMSNKIAEFVFGLEFDWRNLTNNSIQGEILAAISFKDKKIYINETQAHKLRNNLGMWNFTIAHELGHWILHKNLVQEKLPFFDGETLICRGIDKVTDNKERQANLFATYLLMPEKFIRSELKTFTCYKNIVRKMAERFCVSRQTMEIRLVNELKLIYKSGGNYFANKATAMESAGQQKLF